MLKRFIVLGALTMAFTGCFVDEGAQLANEVQKKTMTAENAIENYEWFKRSFEQIQVKNNISIEKQAEITEIKQALKDVEKGSFEEMDLRDELSALKSAKRNIDRAVDELTGEYNARANMAHREVFQDNLPTNIFRGANTMLDYKYGKKLKVLPNSAN